MSKFGAKVELRCNGYSVVDPEWFTPIQLWIFRVPDPKSEPDPTHNIQAYLEIIKITPYSVHMINQKEESTKYEYLPFSISHLS